MKKLMHILSKFFPNSKKGENVIAVNIFYLITTLKGFFKRKLESSVSLWPPLSGNYRVIDPRGKIAVCTLTSDNLVPDISLFQNVAIVGTVVTPNLGIERIIHNMISNPQIRYLVICGKDSPVFKAGQAMECLFKYGIDNEKRIINANGHFPVLKNVSREEVDLFLLQIELVNIRDEIGPDNIHQRIRSIRLNIEPYKHSVSGVNYRTNEDKFIPLKTGGKRVPLNYDTKGFFVITTDSKEKEIVVKHYYKDNQPGFIIKGHSSESILLAILDKGLVSQMSHSGYLGKELAKAEASLKLNLNYTQDQPLRIKR